MGTPSTTFIALFTQYYTKDVDLMNSSSVGFRDANSQACKTLYKFHASTIEKS